jgi:hypothetical protein
VPSAGFIAILSNNERFPVLGCDSILGASGFAPSLAEDCAQDWRCSAQRIFVDHHPVVFFAGAQLDEYSAVGQLETRNPVEDVFGQNACWRTVQAVEVDRFGPA